jgi:hypothetical protein
MKLFVKTTLGDVPSLGVRSLAFAAAIALAGPAGASQLGIPALPVLLGATVNGSIGIGDAVNTSVLSAPGTVNLPPAYSGDWGFASLTATLGADPSITVIFDSTKEFNDAGGGAGDLTLNYYAQYYNPNAADGATIDATFLTGDTLVQSGLSSVYAQEFVEGPTGLVFLAEHCLSQRNGCSSPGLPFPASTKLTLLQNVTYRVNMLIQVSGAGVPPVDGVAEATIDPRFTAPIGGGGQFVFSSGVFAGGVPEPATWALMIGGFGLAGAALRRRRSVVAQLVR